jgi:predicted DNA binding CopG/RHH family protein
MQQRVALARCPDPAHSGREERMLAIGRTIGRRHLLVAFTLRQGGGEVLIRPISARYMHRKRLSTMSDKPRLASLPRVQTDEEVERFVENEDLSRYDLSGFMPSQFGFTKKSARVNMRLPEPLLDAVKARAKARGIPYQRFIREALERAIERQS